MIKAEINTENDCVKITDSYVKGLPKDLFNEIVCSSSYLISVLMDKHCIKGKEEILLNTLLEEIKDNVQENIRAKEVNDFLVRIGIKNKNE